MENRKNDQCSFDAFSDMTAAKKNKVASPGNITTVPDSSTSAHRLKVDIKSKGYEVKKITGSTRLRHSFDEEKTGLHTVSIDTNVTDNLTVHEKHTIATIDTDEFTNTLSTGCSAKPIIIDESDMHPEQDVKLQQTGGLKKEKPLQQRNIPVDISSDIRSHELPSVDNIDQLGSGTVTGILGSGGMARVYKIWNEKLEVYRAVKILLPSMQMERRERFMTEAKIAAKLHHQNIIETYDCGEWHGLPTIEMELIEGTTLNTFIAEHNIIPSPVCASIAIQVARALAYAHRCDIMIYGKNYTGIIHRDLKPSNIMVSGSGIVKLMDFGVARPMETGLHTVVTESIVGTIHYFSPEQMSGYPIDHLTDVYSFGAVLYELLCGSNPFPYSNMITMVQAKTKNQFRRLEDFPVEMDQRIASVAQTCLRTDKRERYANFETIISILGEIQSSYAIGSPHEVITDFCKNPQLMIDTYNQYFKSNRNGTEHTSITLQYNNIASSSERKSLADEQSNETWEPKHLSKSAMIAIAVFFCTLLLAGVFFLVRGKTAVQLPFMKQLNSSVKNDTANVP